MTHAERVDTGKIWPVGIVATGLAAVVNVLLWWLVRAAVAPDPMLWPDQLLPTVILFTAVGGLLGTLVFWFVARRSETPFSTFRTIAIVALLLSFLPNLYFVVTGPVRWPSLVLMVMHVVTAVILVAALETRARA